MDTENIQQLMLRPFFYGRPGLAFSPSKESITHSAAHRLFQPDDDPAARPAVSKHCKKFKSLVMLIFYRHSVRTPYQTNIFQALKDRYVMYFNAFHIFVTKWKFTEVKPG